VHTKAMNFRMAVYENPRMVAIGRPVAGGRQATVAHWAKSQNDEVEGQGETGCHR